MKILPTEISGYLRTLSGDAEVLRLLELSLGRVLDKAGKTALHGPDSAKAAHVADWLTAAHIAREPWIADVDERGRPKKLMKFGSLEQIVKEADKAMAKFSQKHRSAKPRDGDEELFEELEGGFSLVRLLTPDALDRESGEMQHCIGSGAYDGRLESGSHAYLSLRDRHGKAHATVECDVRPSRGWRVEQVQGKQNKEPGAAYVGMLLPFFRKHGMWLSQIGDTVFDRDYMPHDIRDLPDGIAVRGSMCIVGLDNIRLPRTMKVDGDLYIERCECLHLPEKLHVSGYLDVAGGSVDRECDWLTVGSRMKITDVSTPPIGLARNLRGSTLTAVGISTWMETGNVALRYPPTIVDCGIEKLPNVWVDNDGPERHPVVSAVVGPR